MVKQKVTFGDIDIWLKIPVVISWIIIGILGFSFLIGFIEGFLGA